MSQKSKWEYLKAIYTQLETAYRKADNSIQKIVDLLAA